MADGATIPIERTAVPAEIDELLRSLQDLIGAIDPDKASELVTNLAGLLDGQGQSLNDLLGNASGTLDLLADEGPQIQQIITSVSDLSETLKGNTDNISSLVANYNLVAELLLDNKNDVDAMISQLDRVVVELTDLLDTHRDPLGADLAVFADTTGTVDANIDHLRSTLSSTVDLFAAAQRAYDPATQSLRANNQLSPTFTTEILAARMRDRIAGICRRLGIAVCSDPASPFLNKLAGLLPGLLEPLVSGTALEAPSPEVPATPATPSTPTVPAVPPIDTAAAKDDLLSALTDELGTVLDPNQLALLDGLDSERLAALLQVDPALLQVLPKLDPTQIDLVRTVPVEQLSQTLLNLTNQLTPPSERLGPSLPQGGQPTVPTTTPPASQVVTDSLNGLLTALGGGQK